MKVNAPYIVVDGREPDESRLRLDPIVWLVNNEPTNVARKRWLLELKNVVGNYGLVAAYSAEDPRFHDNEAEGIVDVPLPGGVVKLLLLTKERMTDAVQVALSGYDLETEWAVMPIEEVYERVRAACMGQYPS